MKNKSPRKKLKFVLYVLVVVAAGIVVLIASLLHLQVTALTTPKRDQNVVAPAGLACQDVTLTTDDGLTLSAWYIAGTQPNAVILVHGIHANRTYLLPQARILSDAGYPLLLIDLRGHGHSEGKLLTYGHAESLDVRAAVDYLVALPEVERVAAIGHSLGAASVVRAAAADERLEAIVIQSSYSSLAQAVEDSFENFAALPRWPFAPLVIALAEWRTGFEIGQIDSSRDLAAMPPRPIFIIHSADDDVFPVHHAKRMYQAAQEPKTLWIVDGPPHVNPISGHEAEYERRILAFFEMVFAR